MRGSSAGSWPHLKPGSGAQEDVHLFERSEKTDEGVLQFDRPSPRLPEIARPELISRSDRRSAHGAVLVGPLRPRDALLLIDPDGETHPSSMLCLLYDPCYSVDVFLFNATGLPCGVWR
jgi:hypothetical protein